jgi:hypothetical protein
MSARTNDEVTSKDDLRRTLESFQEGLRGQIDDRRQNNVTVGVVVVSVVVVCAYLLGRRGGRRRSTLVEIRRV